MNNTPVISSLQNPLVRQVLRLQQKASERRKTGLFVIEGRREVSLAVRQGIAIDHLFVCNEIYREDPYYPINTKSHYGVTVVSRAVYNRLAYRKDAEGVIMTGGKGLLSLNDLRLPADALILVLEGIEKPGNLGAVLRTADAAGVDALLLADASTDIYNPNAIRASLGCVFTVHTVSCSSIEAIKWLKDGYIGFAAKGCSVYAAALQNSVNYYDCNMRGATALVFGAEHKGLTDIWRRAADQIIKIPMTGAIDSLNLSASVAVLCFEARRQRNTPV